MQGFPEPPQTWNCRYYLVPAPRLRHYQVDGDVILDLLSALCVLDLVGVEGLVGVSASQAVVIMDLLDPPGLSPN